MSEAQQHLYLVDGDWSLSLIAPHEWSEERQQGYVGRCELQEDMTWIIEPSETLGDRPVVVDAIGRFYDAFAETLDSDLTLEEILPFYVGRMPYYQRLYASALSRSIRTAVTLGGQRSIPAKGWLQALPRVENALLAHAR